MSSGPDEYPPYLLKNIVSAISSLVVLAISVLLVNRQSNRSVEDCPYNTIYKKGDSSDPSNYRPVSLTSVFSKLMERIVVL